MREHESVHGVQLIEVDGLLPVTTRRDRDVIGVALLRWLASEIQAQLDAESIAVDVRVVFSCYAGSSYPTLGVQYRAECPASVDVGARVEALAGALLRQASVGSWVRFLAASSDDFAALTEELRAESGGR
jgi:hypothetical protein